MEAKEWTSFKKKCRLGLYLVARLPSSPLNWVSLAIGCLCEFVASSSHAKRGCVFYQWFPVCLGFA